MPESDLPDAFLPSPGDSAFPPARRDPDDRFSPGVETTASREPDHEPSSSSFLPQPPPSPPPLARQEIPAPAFSHEVHLGPDSDPAPAAPKPVARSTGSENSQRAAGIVSIAIMCSRLLGLVREVVLGGMFGGSKWMDGFMIAFRTPNMLRDLFAEGALSTAFITTFSQKLKTEGEQSAWDLARKMLTLTAVFMSLVTIIGILVAPLLVRLFAFGWVKDKPELIPFTVDLSRIIYGFILVLSLAALVMGILNSKGVFFVPAMASSFFNLGSIVSGVAIGYYLDPKFGKNALYGVAIGVVIGGFCQLAVQLPSLRKVGFHFRPDFHWRDPGVSRVLHLMGPAIISGGAVQAGVALNTFFASFLERDGSVSFLQWAFRLMQLPIGIFGVAIATVTLPAASRAATEGISDEFRTIVARGLRLVMVLTIPAALGLALLAEPIISVIWQRGRFTADDTLATAAALRAYALGLVFYAAIKVIQPTFYSIDKKWIPMFISLGAIVLNAGLNTLWVFGLHLGHQYLALSTTVGAILNFGVLYLVMRKYAVHLHTGQLLRTIAKIMVASAGLCSIAALAMVTVFAHWSTQGFTRNALYLTATIGLATVSYVLIAKFLNIQEISYFVDILRRKTRR